MRKAIKYKPKFFPFSPGIPWKVQSGKYIIPEIDFETWHKVLDGKNIIITVFGGLIESFFSLCAAEAISHLGQYNIYWLGNNNYNSFIKFQGLCKLSNINLTKDHLHNYPVPLFFDNDNNAYINILNNYLIRKAYWNKYPEVVDRPIFQQMSDNILLPWNNNIPNLRNLGSNFFDDLYNIGRIKKTSKIISIILNDTNNNVLGWSVQNVKGFSQLASHKGWKVIVFSKNINMFHGSNILAFEYSINNILQIIRKSWVVLSNDINWLLVSLLISDAKIISNNVYNQYNLFKNAEFIGAQNDIFTDRNVLPVDAFGICEGL